MANKEELKKFFIIFIVVSLIVFAFLNWSIIKGVFNYKNIYAGLFASKNEKQEIILEDMNYFEKSDSVEIPKLGVNAPLIFVDNNNLETFSEGLDRGVVQFPDSSLPGGDGQVIILGHSAPSGWLSKNYEDIFTKINELVDGDEIYIFYNHKKYVYFVKKQVILAQGEDLPVLDNYNQQLALVSCWPPGKSIKRIAVLAVREY